MGSVQQLVDLGIKIKNLSFILYGSTNSPIEKVPEISARTGIRSELVQAALIAVEGEGSVLP